MVGQDQIRGFQPTEFLRHIVADPVLEPIVHPDARAQKEVEGGQKDLMKNSEDLPQLRVCVHSAKSV
jgi:hypothetical protein